MAFNRNFWLWDVFKEAVNMRREERAKPAHQKLAEAATEGDYRKVERLLDDPKIDINHRDAHNRTPLMNAVMRGSVSGTLPTYDHKRVIALLVAHNADTSGVDDKGRDIWTLAGDATVIRDMLPRKTPAAKPGNPGTPRP